MKVYNNYKESDIFDELLTSEFNFIRNTDININTDIEELIEQLESLMHKNGIETESGQIIKGIIDKLTSVDLNNYYRIIFVDEDLTNRIIYAKSDLKDFKIGDEVFLEKNNYQTEGYVMGVAYYKKDNIPFLLDKLYTVTEIYYRSDDY